MRRAEFGAEVRDWLRPRHLGLLRDRGPITLQLFRAAAEGRLVWRGFDSFAMLRSPGDRPGRGGRFAVLRAVDHSWHLALVVGSFLMFLGGALILVALRDVLDHAVLYLVAVLLELALLLVVVTDQVTGLVRMCVRGLRSLGRPGLAPHEAAAQRWPYERWTLAVCHHPAATGGSELLDEVWQRLVALAGPDPALACPRAAVSTSGMRTLVGDWAHGVDMGVDDPAVRLRFTGRKPQVAQRMTETGAFFFLYLAAVAALLAGVAPMVAQAERAGCADTCAERPATYGTALEWLAYRLLWQNPQEPRPETFEATSFGFGASVLGLVGIFVGVAAMLQYTRHLRKQGADVDALVEESGRRGKVLLLVATPVEQAVVLDRVRQRTGRAAERLFGGYPVHKLGVLGATELVLARTGPGVTSPVSAAYGVPELVREQRPDYVISLGICYGLREEFQAECDVIVAQRLRVINVRVGEGADGDIEIRERGDSVTAGPNLVARFMMAEPPAGFRIHMGELLSWDVLVDNSRLREALRMRYQDALGGEMEGAGVYAAAVRKQTEWIVVKGISDWGHGKRDDVQEKAAGNAAAVVLDLVGARAFARRDSDAEPA